MGLTSPNSPWKAPDGADLENNFASDTGFCRRFEKRNYGLCKDFFLITGSERFTFYKRKERRKHKLLALLEFLESNFCIQMEANSQKVIDTEGNKRANEQNCKILLCDPLTHSYLAHMWLTFHACLHFSKRAVVEHEPLLLLPPLASHYS